MTQVDLEGVSNLKDAVIMAEGRTVALNCSCERSILDALNEIASLVRSENFHADCGVNSPFSVATAERLEAFLAAANDLVAVLKNGPGPLRVSKFNTGRAPADNELSARIAHLTERQKHVLRLVLQGLQNKAIAFQLNISETTVKAHVGAILQKLKVYNRARAIALYANVDWEAIIALGN